MNSKCEKCGGTIKPDVVLYEEGLDDMTIRASLNAIQKADEYRGEYDVALYEKPKKIGKLFGKLEESGYYGCLILDESTEIKVLNK